MSLTAETSKTHAMWTPCVCSMDANAFTLDKDISCLLESLAHNGFHWGLILPGAAQSLIAEINCVD